MNTMQTKPLRAYGIDVTQSSLQPIVKELGITDSDGNVKSVKNMSQAEKEILRYIATLKQAKIAMGDLANTINKSVAHIRNYMMKKLVNLYKKGVKIVKNSLQIQLMY